MYERIEGLIGVSALSKIQDSSVMIVGIGGVGGSAVESLVRSGIGNIILIDFDVVDISNLNRQIIANMNVIGRKKVDVCIERIKSINPNCKVIGLDLFLDFNNISDILDEYKVDYVIDSCDFVDAKKALIKETIKRNIKLITCLGTGNKLDPTKLKITDIRKTFNDPLARKMRKWIKDEKITSKITVLCSEELPIKKGRVISSMCFVPNTAGIMLANYVVMDIIKEFNYR